eukprot:scaffold27254_cov70-Phaeocystis_antarctica.AAC.2
MGGRTDGCSCEALLAMPLSGSRGVRRGASSQSPVAVRRAARATSPPPRAGRSAAPRRAARRGAPVGCRGAAVPRGRPTPRPETPRRGGRRGGGGGGAA